MNLVADESVANPIIERLRADGHEVYAIADWSAGDDDPRVLARAVAEQLPLLTEDKDFGELVFRDGSPHRGVILLRISAAPRGVRPEIVSRAIRDNAATLPDRFVVVTPGGVRFRDEPAETA